MMKNNKICLLTFHGSYNYGSGLQTYALQQTIKKIGKNEIDFNVLNYRSFNQKKKYESIFLKRDLKSLYSQLLFFNKKKELDKKRDLFESFINNNLDTSIEINNQIDFDTIIRKYNSIIVGSDQVWNLRASDFSWNYFVPYKNINKYSYAASIGTKDICCDNSEEDTIKKLINDFKFVSVREIKSKMFIKKYYTNSDVYINCDPTLLLSKEDWLELIQQSKIDLPKRKYILFYDLSRNKDNWIIAKKISKRLKLPLLITTIPFPRVLHESISTNIIKKMDVGPKEWLKLLYNAEYVISTSFHGTVFSTIFEKKFFTINADSDNRISFFLNNTSLNNRNINSFNSFLDINYNLEPDFSKAKEYIKKEKLSSNIYLNNIIKNIINKG